jgi:hypothetical protein
MTTPALAFLRAAVAALGGADDPDIIAGREAVAAWLDGEANGLSFEEATDLLPAVGQRSWRRQDAAALRNNLIRELARDHFQHFAPRDRAGAIAQHLAEYGARHWWQEAKSSRNPHEAGSLDALVWNVFSAQRDMQPGHRHVASAPSSRTIRQVLQTTG